MTGNRTREALILGVLLGAGLTLLGWFTAQGIVRLRALDRTVTVKGLAEQEVPADIAIWPITFAVAGDDLARVTADLERNTGLVLAFLETAGFTADEVTTGVPAIIDKQAERYGGGDQGRFRYLGNGTVTVYSPAIEKVRAAMRDVGNLGKQGVAVGSQNYDSRTQFLFTGLNTIKPGMIEEATRNAREVAEKFARDSDSNLGKIKQAWQGQFSIEDRDSNTPHIKKVRVVATLEYYLVD
ncbi:MAG: SIMPL domain-containing protein [bacterium]